MASSSNNNRDIDLIDSLGLGKPNQNKWRTHLRKGKVFLTYSTHLPKNAFITWIKNKGKKCRVFVAHETADPRNPYEHSHVLIIYDDKLDTTNCRYYDYEDIHPNIQWSKNNNHLLNLIKYMYKEDKSLEEDMKLLAEEFKLTLFEKVSECKDIYEVMNMAHSAGEAMGLEKLWHYRKNKQKVLGLIKKKWFYPYQRYLFDMIIGPRIIDDRTIIWFADFLGRSGKTQFMKYMGAKYRDKVVTATGLGGSANTANMMKGKLDEGWDHTAVIVNLVRATKDKKIYEPLEGIKDGVMTNTKYIVETLYWTCPILIVFANYLPRVEDMSIDRWDIRILKKVEGIPTIVDKIDGKECMRRTKLGLWDVKEWNEERDTDGIFN